MKKAHDLYASYLDILHQKDLWRSLRPGLPEQGARVVRDGRTLVNFSSNDYLGLSFHPLLVERAQEFAARWGAGSGSSRLVCGELEVFGVVERKLARAKGAAAALVLNSGYQANATVLAALLDRSVVGREPLVFSDRLNHASMHFGCKAAGVPEIRYRHNDLSHLEQLLQKYTDHAGPRFVLSETVFSMDGDVADVQGLASLATQYGAFLYLDEAHATGVCGQQGFGLAAGLPQKMGSDVLVMGTFSKALGSFGAYVACSQVVKDLLINRCAGFIYSTALPPAVWGAIDAALDLVPTLEDLRRNLSLQASQTRSVLAGMGLNTGTSSTQIIPVIVGKAETALDISRELAEEGLLAVPIRPPTVPEGAARLRLCLTAAHSAQDVAFLTENLQRIMTRYGVI